MFIVVKKIYSLLSKHERKQLYGVFVAVLIMGFFEVVGVGSILPFLSVASNPEIIQSNEYLRWGFEIFDFSSTTTFLIALGGLTILVLTVTQLFSAFTTYLIQNFGNMRNYTLSVRLFHKYLHQPYTYFLNQNSSGLNKMILAEVQQVVKKVLLPVAALTAKVVASLSVLGLLLALDPLLAVLVVLVLGGSYLIVFLFVKNTLTALGRKSLDANGLRFKITAEAFGGIKDIKILGKENIFVNEFRDPSKKLSKCFVYSSLISDLPHYVISLLAFSGILLITIYLIATKENFQQALPVIGLYAFAGYRLLPAIRAIFSQITTIRTGLPALDILYDDLKDTKTIEVESIPMTPDLSPLPFKRSLELKNMMFSYPGTDVPVLENIDLTIDANTSIGIVGVTGCGKTTLIDIILGLLIPQQGEMMADRVKIHQDNILQWQQNLGYVPQQIFLSDDTIASNIAFGIPEDQIDFNAVEKAARIANLHEFVVHDLPHGYDTLVGERGIRLSGGQRQRIGIARALYHDPAFLIFDEATSALDNITETAVMEAINNLSGQKTIIMIAHRLTTVKPCDVIYVMDKGKIVAQGDYDMLMKTSAEFQKMVSAN